MLKNVHLKDVQMCWLSSYLYNPSYKHLRTAQKKMPRILNCGAFTNSLTATKTSLSTQYMPDIKLKTGHKHWTRWTCPNKHTHNKTTCLFYIVIVLDVASPTFIPNILRIYSLFSVLRPLRALLLHMFIPHDDHLGCPFSLI